MRPILLSFAIVFTVAFICVFLANFALWINFKKGCADYLKLAGDAPDIYKAQEFLSKALDFMEKTGRTKGNSAFFFKTPRNDVGTWYQQIKGAEKTLKELIEQEKVEPHSVDRLTKDNALMKIREVVLDEGNEGVRVTLPQHIDVFPKQVLFLFLYMGFGILAAIFWLGWIFLSY